MVKKCIVKYDEKGNPIELVELKEFTDPLVLKSFKEKCEENKAEYNKRLREKAEKEQAEKAQLNGEILLLKDEIKLLKSVLKHILGYEELDEDSIASILGIEGESEHE